MLGRKHAEELPSKVFLHSLKRYFDGCQGQGQGKRGIQKLYPPIAGRNEAGTAWFLASISSYAMPPTSWEARRVQCLPAANKS